MATTNGSSTASRVPSARAYSLYRELHESSHRSIKFFGNCTTRHAYWLRFSIPELTQLAVALRLPEHIITSERDHVLSVQALALVCRRLAEPIRWSTLESEFRRSGPSLCRLFYCTVGMLYANHRRRIFFNVGLVTARMHEYCDAVRRKGSPLTTCWGFIDGTKQFISRPGPRSHVTNENLQRAVFNDGMCASLYGPLEGRKHDSTMLTTSGVCPMMATYPTFDGKLIYGDAGYPVLEFVCAPFRAAELTTEQQAFNTQMSACRQSVEWRFKVHKVLWPHSGWRLKLKVRSAPVGKVFAVGMLLTNCHTCIKRGNQISDYFILSPPSLEDYLQ
ncbi:TPA: hypothetical protein N0F65_000470 [Lagenidium giganteum]|uniref:DDE Tnp4 domain-containing protein n=1 Tax=Lagenidium giganteum TaxID=4803 RepID=A0AAV2Z3V9_9STRA|nr:TPA: hypothetical protein N0F65_000470 [Lagenidium giganteum]